MTAFDRSASGITLAMPSRAAAAATHKTRSGRAITGSGPTIRAWLGAWIGAAALVASAALLPLSAQADDKARKPRPPAEPELELQATATGFASNDEMVVHLNADESGNEVGPLNDKVLEAMNQALETARQQAGVKARVGSVNTMPIHDREGQRTSWRVVGTVILEGTDLKATGDLAGRLARDLHLASVQYRLTPARRVEAENRLIDEAAAAFRDRAGRASRALGYDGYRLQSVNVQTSTSGPRPPMPMMMKSAMASDHAEAAVPAEGGDATIEVIFFGKVGLR